MMAMISGGVRGTRRGGRGMEGDVERAVDVKGNCGMSCRSRL